MDRKYLPLILMLIAGAATCIIMFFRQYSMLQQLIALLIVLVVFYGLGCILKGTLDFFDRENEKKTSEEGEVIEKGDDSNG
jgi:Na+-translocating ferredoxin:NAD+ oxidoreductase RnfE subunit